KRQLLDDPLFRQEMTGVVPLRTRPTTDSKPPRKPIRSHKPGVYPDPANTPALATADDPTHINAEDGSSHRKNGIQNRTMQKLKRGRFKVGAELDLHSMTMETAHAVLLEFIADAKSSSLETIRIIHGKGLRSENGPKLKLMTRQVLRDHPLVLAYTTCKPSDGGSGAVDVLLKSS
ncbi:MAG TPA: Smr/MutS family protein, partial [Xanthomonadales bacterium]